MQEQTQPSTTAMATRYLPLLIALALLASLVALAPTKQPSAKKGFDFASGAAPGDVPATGVTGGGDVGPVVDTPTSLSNGSSLVSGGTTTQGGGATSGSPTGGSAPTAAPGGPAATVAANGVTKCAGAPAQPGWAAGMQPAPYPTGVPCLQFAGQNGGASTSGVTATGIRYTLWMPQTNAATNALLAGAGLSLTPEQICAAGQHYQETIQKRYQLYGRKLVPVDGPGSNAGSSRSESCKYPYFQSQCSTSGQVDPACLRAEADTMASLGVTFVLSYGGGPVMLAQLARRGVVMVGADGFGLVKRSLQDQVAPYSWNFGATYERAGQLISDFACKQLIGRPPQYAGAPINQKPLRRTGFVYATQPGDDSTRQMVELYLAKAKACGDTGAKAYPYTPDTTRAQTDAINIVGQMQADGVTTYIALCEYITGIAILKQMDNNGYYPEILLPPVLGLTNDFIGRIGAGISPTQYSHAFGLAESALGSQSLDEFNAVWADGGGGAQPLAAAPIWQFFKLMARLIHMAGPAPAPRSIFDGGQAMPRSMPTVTTVGGAFGPPDRFSYARDVAVVWWKQNQTSEFDGAQGAFCWPDGARRYDIGQFPAREVALFGKSGPCATSKR